MLPGLRRTAGGRYAGLALCRGHSFDVARQGYVNLLTVNRKHSRSPGDSPVQVAARREFLNAGYYTPLAERVCAAMAAERPQTLLDAGAEKDITWPAWGSACRRRSAGVWTSPRRRSVSPQCGTAAPIG